MSQWGRAGSVLLALLILGGCELLCEVGAPGGQAHVPCNIMNSCPFSVSCPFAELQPGASACRSP